MGRFRSNLDLRSIILILIPFLAALVVWLSPLAFVPTPWPDDAAFYFVAKELFRWPPRWVMLPQAPFEPTYAIFNFNTMPLYPILLGLGKWIGIDGSFLLKIWPLGAWALSGSLLGFVLYRKGLPFFLTLPLVLAFSLDPELRWAAVLVRPESLIGLFGLILILGLVFGFPKRFEPKETNQPVGGIWDPIAALLALAAYSHFNAIHLIWPVMLVFAFNPKRLIQIGLKTTIYLSPWCLAVLFHLEIFIKQMTVQWQRCHLPNTWLRSISSAADGLFQGQGSPIPWPPVVKFGGVLIWAIIFFGSLYLLTWFLLPWIERCIQSGFSIRYLGKVLQEKWKALPLSFPALIWVFAAVDLFTAMPEAWFVYYIHLAFWCFTGLLALQIWKLRSDIKRILGTVLGVGVFTLIVLFTYVDFKQAEDLTLENSWEWKIYDDFIECIDNRLTELEKNLIQKRGSDKPFRVWCPTPPDITIELSRRHPHWELTRTNDFPNRNGLAIRHGWEVEAVAQAETVNYEQRDVSGRAEFYREIRSVWMTWTNYFLYNLWSSPGWKPNRYICQRGRWQAFLFMVSEDE